MTIAASNPKAEPVCTTQFEPAKEADPNTQPYLPGLELIAPFVEHTDNNQSNTVEFFDALVVFSMDHAREGQRFIEVEKVFRGRTFKVRVAPATVERGGKPIMVLPGLRENLVEKALRKIASEDQEHLGVTFNTDTKNAEFWVKFTLYQLRKTLSGQGHDFKISQLVEALEVLRGARLTITGEIGAFADGADTNYLQSLVWRRKRTNDVAGKEYKICAKLHPYITRSIVDRTFRQIDFAKLMQPKNELARWLFQRMSHNYIQADHLAHVSWQRGSKNAGYHLSLLTIIRETGLSFASLKYAMAAVRTALEVLRKHDILRSTTWLGEPFKGWEEVKHYGDSKGGRKPITDVIFYLFPSLSVTEDIIKAGRK